MLAHCTKYVYIYTFAVHREAEELTDTQLNKTKATVLMIITGQLIDLETILKLTTSVRTNNDHIYIVFINKADRSRISRAESKASFDST